MHIIVMIIVKMYSYSVVEIYSYITICKTLNWQYSL